MIHRPWLYYAASLITIGIFFVPLLVALNSFIFPFIVLKVFVFRSLTAMLVGVYLLLWYRHPQQYRPYMTSVHWAMAFFLASLIASTVFALDVRRALWDNHERMLGLVTIVHVVGFAFVVSWIFRTKEEILRLWHYFLYAGTAVMLVGALQVFGDKPILMSSGGRVHGTLGNPIYFSAYGLFLFFSGAICAYIHRRTKWLVYLSSFCALLGFFGIFWGGTRGTILGLLVSMVSIAVVYGFLSKEKQHTQYVFVVLAMLACVGMGLFAYRQTEFVQSIPGIGRLMNTTLSFDTSSTRLMAWQVGVEAWQQKPLFGWGINGFFFAFNQYFNPHFLTFGYGETWFDNAHNVLVNTLTTQGIFGLVAYLLLFVSVCISLWRLYRQQSVDLFILIGSFGFLVGHFVNNLFVFESPTSYMYFFFFLATVGVFSRSLPPLFPRHSDIAQRAPTSRVIPMPMYVVVGVVVALFVLVCSINPAKANRATLDVMRLLNAGRTQEAMALYEVVQQMPTPHRDDVRSDVARTIAAVVMDEKISSRLVLEEKRRLLAIAYQQVEQNIVEYPYDVRHYIAFAQLAQSMVVLSENPGVLLQQAIGYINTAIELSPKRQQLYFMKGSLTAQMGDLASATRLFEYGLNLDPTVPESWNQYLRFLQITQQGDLYTQAMNSVVEQGVFTSEELPVFEPKVQ